MNKIFFVFLVLISSLIAQERISFVSSEVEKEIPEEYKAIPKYTIQLTTTKTLETAKKNLARLPKIYRDKTKLYKVGCYVTARYGADQNMTALRPMVKELRSYGFKDAYILQTTKWHMLTNYIHEKQSDSVPMRENKEKGKEKIEKKREAKKVEEKIFIKKKQISKFTQSNMIIKADKAYKGGDEDTAMVYYEMLLNSGYTTEKIKNNLCYFYGKKGAWLDAQNIIEKERFASKLLYAYAYGALESNQDGFIQNISEYLLLDKTGRLALLAGYYYEQREDLARAIGYYKISYEKNPSDVYNIYAYARALDIDAKYDMALKYYKRVLSKMTKKHQNYNLIAYRINQLEE